MFNFERLDILCAWIGHSSEKLWPFELLESFCCSFFVRLDISLASHIHLSQKLWLFEFPESFRIQFLVSRYIMRRHRTSDWKVMTIWISRELLLFIFERLEISWASHIHPSQKFWPIKFAKGFRVQFRTSRYMLRLNWTSKWKVLTIWISLELPLLIFVRLDISWASHIIPSQKLRLFEFAERFRVQFWASRYIMEHNQKSSQKLWESKFARSFHVQFRASQYIIGLKQTSESNVVLVWIF